MKVQSSRLPESQFWANSLYICAVFPDSAGAAIFHVPTYFPVSAYIGVHAGLHYFSGILAHLSIEARQCKPLRGAWSCVGLPADGRGQPEGVNGARGPAETQTRGHAVKHECSID